VKRLWLCALFLLVTVAVSCAQVEIWVDRVEENGRLLIPVRAASEATGASVQWDAASSGVHVVGGGNDVWMWVNNTGAVLNGYDVYLDVPPRNIGGRVHIPLRFLGESLGRTVQYLGDRVVLSSATAVDVVLHLSSGSSGPSGPSGGGELMPQSDDRQLHNGDLAGRSNWNLTLARNEIYARYGRPFNNDLIRGYFLNTGWYSPNPNFRESWLTPLESRNAAFIADYQKRVFGAAATRP